jgi:hypothetical protein
MKAKVIRGSGFQGLLNYVFDCGPRALGKKMPEIVGGNMAGKNALILTKEFSVAKSLRSDIEKPVWHCSLSLPAGEKLSGFKWGEITDSFMKSMGFTDAHQYVAVRHSDTEYDHVHIVASRISVVTGDMWLGKWEAHEAIRITQELEQKFGLVQTEGYTGKKERKSLTSKEINMAVRTGEVPPKMKLQNMLDELTSSKPSVVELVKELENRGVTVKIKLYQTGTISGISFGLDGITFKGSSLGKGYSWGGLLKKGVSYEQARHSEELRRYAEAGQHDERADQTIGDDKQAIGGDRAILGRATEGSRAGIGESSGGQQSSERDQQPVESRIERDVVAVSESIGERNKGNKGDNQWIQEGGRSTKPNFGELRDFEKSGQGTSGNSEKRENIDVGGIRVEPSDINGGRSTGSRWTVFFKEAIEENKKNKIKKQKEEEERIRKIKEEEETERLKLIEERRLSEEAVKEEEKRLAKIEELYKNCLCGSAENLKKHLLESRIILPRQYNNDYCIRRSSKAGVLADICFRGFLDNKKVMQPVIAIKKDSIAILKAEEKEILIGLELAKKIWDGQEILVNGTDEFKKKVREVVSKYKVSVRLKFDYIEKVESKQETKSVDKTGAKQEEKQKPLQRPKPEPEQERPAAPRPRGMGR